MVQFPISYYFYIGEPQTALAGILPYIAELASRAGDVPNQPGMKMAAAVLGGAVEDFAAPMAEIFLDMPNDDCREILLAYAREQMCVPVLLRKSVAEFKKKPSNAA
jgi:hypothetical protein